MQRQLEGESAGGAKRMLDSRKAINHSYSPATAAQSERGLDHRGRCLGVQSAMRVPKVGHRTNSSVGQRRASATAKIVAVIRALTYMSTQLTL